MALDKIYGIHWDILYRSSVEVQQFAYVLSNSTAMQHVLKALYFIHSQFFTLLWKVFGEGYNEVKRDERKHW